MSPAPRETSAQDISSLSSPVLMSESRSSTESRYTNTTELQHDLGKDTQFAAQDILFSFSAFRLIQRHPPFHTLPSTMSSSRSGRSGGSSSHRSSKSSKKPRAVQVSEGLFFVLSPPPVPAHSCFPITPAIPALQRHHILRASHELVAFSSRSQTHT